ncbi:MAG: dienelactone hydrolase family protein [Devosia sp.]
MTTTSVRIAIKGLISAFFVLLSASAFGQPAYNTNPGTSGHFISNGNSVRFEYFSPIQTADRGVVILPGIGGMEPPFDEHIRSYANDLADSGVAALIVQYLDATGTAPVTDRQQFVKFMASSALQNLPVWTMTAVAAADELDSLMGDSIGERGLFGISMGAAVGVLAAASPSGTTRFGKFVDFYGPVQKVAPALTASFPETKIFHDQSDEVVEYSESVWMEGQLRSLGVDVELVSYSCQLSSVPHCHGFDLHPMFDSMQRVTTFFTN